MQQVPSRRSRSRALVPSVCLVACSAAAALFLITSPALRPLSQSLFSSLDEPAFVVYIGSAVPDGSLINLDSAQSAPLVRASPAASSLTIIMFDPDAPSPASPTCRSWIHWLLIDASVAANSPPSPPTGHELVPFAPPTPPPASGVHRYVVRIYQQPLRLLAAPAPQSRCGFSVDDWADAHALQLLHEQMFRARHS